NALGVDETPRDGAVLRDQQIVLEAPGLPLDDAPSIRDERGAVMDELVLATHRIDAGEAHAMPAAGLAGTPVACLAPSQPGGRRAQGEDQLRALLDQARQRILAVALPCFRQALVAHEKAHLHAIDGEQARGVRSGREVSPLVNRYALPRVTAD